MALSTRHGALAVTALAMAGLMTAAPAPARGPQLRFSGSYKIVTSAADFEEDGEKVNASLSLKAAVPLRRRGRTFTGSGPLKWVKHAYEARFENACSVRGDQAAKPAVARAVAARGSTFRVVRARLGKTPEVVVNTGAPALKVHYDCPPGGRDRNQWEWPWHGLAFAAVRLNEWPPRFENDRGYECDAPGRRACTVKIGEWRVGGRGRSLRLRGSTRVTGGFPATVSGRLTYSESWSIR